MANALGVLSSGSEQFLHAAPLVDPQSVRGFRARFARSFVEGSQHANAFYAPAGRWPARGWVLLRRGDYASLDPYSTDLVLELQSFDAEGGAGPVVRLRGLTVVQATCVTRGLPADPDAVYLVELTDRRGVLTNRWFEAGLVAQYNVQSPAYPGGYYAGSLVAGVPYTWAALVADLWARLALGPFPGLPLPPPSGTPADWVFPGVPAWDALNRVLEQVGLLVSYDPTLPSPYGVVRPGDPDAPHALKEQAYAGLVLDDHELIDHGSGRVPGQVVVYFHRGSLHYGSEELVRGDSFQWQAAPLYPVVVAAPTWASGARGTHAVWDDFVVRFDHDGVPLPADAATAAAVAAERALQYYQTAYAQTLGAACRVYAAALPFAAGSLADGVAWRTDEAGRGGWVTEVVRRPGLPPWGHLREGA